MAHETAVGESGDVDPAVIDSRHRRDSIDDRLEEPYIVDILEQRISAAAEGVPRIVHSLRVGHNEARLIRLLPEARYSCLLARIRSEAVKVENQRDWNPAGITGRYVDIEGTCSIIE